MTCFNTDCRTAGKCVAPPNTGCRASIVIPPPAPTLDDDALYCLWLNRTKIHNGELKPQLLDYARAVLAYAAAAGVGVVQPQQGNDRE